MNLTPNDWKHLLRIEPSQKCFITDVKIPGK